MRKGAHIELPPEAALDRYAAMLRDSPINLVARGERERVRTRHVADAALVGEAVAPRAGSRWLDLGTGGGLPGLVLALQHPATTWVLVDAARKKTDAVRGFLLELGISNATTRHGRAEALARSPHYREQFDGVIARAVAALPALAELARGFLRPGGQLVAVKGPQWKVELDGAARALAELNLEVMGSRHLESAAVPTWLVTLRATGRCPAAFPRRDGIPSAHPLGGPAA